MADHGQATFGAWAKGWYVFHKACQKHFCRGDYSDETAAKNARDVLVANGTGQCPGCSEATPDNGHYTVRQVTP